jgi:hypothetical protein
VMGNSRILYDIEKQRKEGGEDDWLQQKKDRLRK